MTSRPAREAHDASDARQELWRLTRDVHEFWCELVATVDSVEIEYYRNSRLRRRQRFITDALARARADRVRRRLEQRGFAPVAAL